MKLPHKSIKNSRSVSAMLLFNFHQSYVVCFRFVKEKRFSFLNEIGKHCKEHDIPESMVLNWDQTPINYIPAGKWTMEKQGASKVAIAGQSDKRSLTAVLTVTLAGDFLPPQLIYAGKTSKCTPSRPFPEGFHITQNPSHWSNEDAMNDFIDYILTPYIEQQRNKLNRPDVPGLLIFDAFRGHTTDAITSKLVALNCKLVQVPKNMTDHLQPLDISVNKPVKGYLKNRFNSWYAGKISELEQNGERSYESVASLLKSSVVLRDLSADWITDMYNHFQLPPQREIVINGFRHCGICGAHDQGPQNDDPFAATVL